MDGEYYADWHSVTVACQDCNQTGLYKGFAEPEGTAVICRTCHGTGGRMIRFQPYTGRKKRAGIDRIEVANIFWFAPEESKTISYEEFESKVPQTPQEEPR